MGKRSLTDSPGVLMVGDGRGGRMNFTLPLRDKMAFAPPARLSRLTKAAL
ncbi:hypothetical protein [Prevotella dentasini]|nr:hypothetical protein [Prevotella dentasini]